MLIKDANWENEILYQIFPRSFYDSNGDKNGDFMGIIKKLDYLEKLGVTALWLNPIFISPTPHNYFPTDFFTTDPEFGTNEEFWELVDELHNRNMKILIDMETQYVPRNHIWFKDSYKNPESIYSKYLYYNDSQNSDPVFLSIVMPISEKKFKKIEFKEIIAMNLRNKVMKDFQKKIFTYWVDPLGDGSLTHGVDGFRMDHIMDDLDLAGKNTNLYKELWKPVVDSTKKIKKDIFYIAEPADWGKFDDELLSSTGMNALFDFNMCYSIKSFNVKKITTTIKERESVYDNGKYVGIFLENHDMDRFGSVVKSDRDKLRIGAACNILLKGIPILYSGQELGMTGKVNSWGNKSMHLPVRQAFKWSCKQNDDGNALWYDSDNYSTIFEDSTVPSYQEQVDDPDSLWNFYKKLITIRKASPALKSGTINIVPSNNKNVFAFVRQSDNLPKQNICVIINMHKKDLKVSLNLKKAGMNMVYNPKNLLNTNRKPNINLTKLNKCLLSLNPYEIMVLEL